MWVENPVKRHITEVDEMYVFMLLERSTENHFTVNSRESILTLHSN